MARPTVARDYGVAPPGYRLPEETRLGGIALQVSDLECALAYYRDVLGLTLLAHDASSARLAVQDASQPLIELRHTRGTRPVLPGGLLGLYHFAILLPSRPALGRFVRHLTAAQARFSAADHFVSEAIYLWDPDGLGIEVYADRPREVWRTSGRELVMTTERLDLQSVADTSGDEPWNGMPPGTTMGHMHLSVDDLERARDFYHRGLGLDTVVWSYPGALFMSAGGYHHHLGTNIWTRGARRPAEDDARLIEWEIVLPAASDVDDACASLSRTGYRAAAGRAVDPWGTSLRLTAAS